MAGKSLGPPPSDRKAELIEAIARAGASLVPVAGGSLAELAGVVIGPNLKKRREEWFTQLGAEVQKLLDRPELDPERLGSNEMFVTAVLMTTAAAMKTHQQEKLEALRNAVLQSALPMAPDDHTQLMFIRYIDELTALHLQVLAYLRNPARWFDRNDVSRPDFIAGPRRAVLEAALPDLKGRSDLIDQLMRELSDRGLGGNGINGMVSATALYDPLTTPLGNSFLDYIAPVD